MQGKDYMTISIMNASVPDKPAIVCRGNATTYRQLSDRAGSLAGGFLAQGCRRGDKILTVLDNCPELMYVYYACSRTALMAVPVMGVTRAETIADIIEETRPRILVTESKYAAKVARFSDQLDIYLTDASDAAPGHRPLSRLMGGNAVPEPHQYPPDQTMIILYTTGSTGKPKGVMHTARTILLYAGEFERYHQSTPAERALICLSLSHIYNLMLAFCILYVGGTIYIEPNDSSADVLMKSIVENEITVTAAVPSMYRLLIEHAAGKPAVHHHLRFCTVCGDIVPRPLHTDFEKAFGVMLNEKLGSTEFITATSNPMDDAKKRPGSAGIAFPNVQIRIDQPDQEGRGEILVKSPYLLQRYYNEELSRENEWLHTGDVGILDEEGYLWFQGRMKDLIVHNGYNISPLEIEALLYEYPGVKEAVVIGVPSELYGEDLVVYVTFAPEAGHGDENAIREFMVSRLEYFKHPSKVVVLDSLPKNQMGKVDRTVLKRWEPTR